MNLCTWSGVAREIATEADILPDQVQAPPWTKSTADQSAVTAHEQEGSLHRQVACIIP